ncbi:hypothetical protein A2926_03120 [Candidatus Giovannonibacteria bacterium RIFCSPLOWO2_01_FULL_44_40]|uniref:NAD kinase n=1 Tax=Candidatus Giovannonibacteria bacterium RIFCSPHIGHO2_01_FULL_45_23 TaxID=1798325 RepID=A0A1F5VE41_9BACT|nr:MAG: hypothetical protein A2834_00760 [Candidatus Giovannonibacteria bacterium RIFCSPHIGHO2_01_FULL_45_23]OGF75759.1 MAG: hypothetical protein A3C77_02505 [Candidatus Giovannonibacteria bacterium RIFCSPHIGHO2_02_FULL_45_13]OGF79848.1 MAG: hypothetical protein A2926_03120 [Candidatus Giovannonibacteria bacterium RIFCSPLOWO2_01_FULL_44_40]
MIKRVSIYYRGENKEAVLWSGKIEAWIRKRYPKTDFNSKRPQLLIVLGGDGTILAAAQKYQKKNSIIFGLNLGHVGFLASAREPKKFLAALNKLFSGEYRVVKRMMVKAEVWRKGRLVFSANSLNEISVQSLLGIVDIEASIDKHPVQYIKGSGMLVATATGSTAYNLSAHGPIVMPDIKCMILTEIMDHNIPTPSIVIKRDREVELKIIDFRKRGVLKIAKSGEDADVIITADGENIFPLEIGDVIKIKRSPGLIKFAELDRAYFFKSLQEKFAFR